MMEKSLRVFSWLHFLSDAEDMERVKGSSYEIAGAFLKRLQKLSVLVRSVPKKFSYPRDEDDEPYINLAVEASADFIITRDKDLLDLMTGHTDECKEFRQRFRSLKVVEPVEFLNLLEDSESK